MVSQRQRLARKRFKEENPEIFPKQPPAQPKDPSKKKIGKFKRKKAKSNDPTKAKASYKKHPLRVSGMKPGESCYICKALEHIAKNCPKKLEWERNKVCLLCRRRGHSLKNCPDEKGESGSQKLCYNCGETGHSLDKCQQPIQDGGTRYANCFICNQSGHLSKSCPKNTHGIYLKGGCCKICGGVTHLARDCPNKHSQDTSKGYHKIETQERPNRITKFVSGDDLEDDFTSAMDDDKGESAKKSKTKQETKIVQFLG